MLVFSVVHMQIAVATDKLPREHLKDVVNACLQVLREVQRQSYDDLSENWRSYDVEMLCAFVNDNQRLQENCDGNPTLVVTLIILRKTTRTVVFTTHEFIFYPNLS